MKKDMLLPYGFKKVGWVLLITVVLYHVIVTLILGHDNEEVGKAIFKALGISLRTSDRGSGLNGLLSYYNAEQLLNNICIFAAVIGGLFVGCSREKIEDEMIGHIRLDSLLAALWVNYIILLISALLVYNISFLDVLVYNMFTMLIIFIAVFRFKLWRLRKEAGNEK